MAAVTAPSITLEEFARLPENGAQHEVSNGILISSPPPKSLRTLVAQALQELLFANLKREGRSRALVEAGYLLSAEPLTIRQPDVSVLSCGRIQATAADSYFAGAPELAVEIISPSDAAEDVELKVHEYLQAGAKEVWLIYPKTKTIHILQAGAAQILRESDTLESHALLPGFSVKVGDLFPT